MDDFKLDPAKDLGLPLDERMKSLRREPELVDSGLNMLWWTAVRAYLGAWHRLEVLGRDNLPAGPPFVLIANHASHLDTFALGAALPWRRRRALFPIAAGDTFFESLPVAAFAAFVLNALPLWRRRGVGRHTLEQLRVRLVEGGCSYILFPEGTRSRGGDMAPFKPGIGMLVAGTEVPVVPCHIEGAHAALPPGRHLPRWKKLRVRIGEPRTFKATPNDREGWAAVAEDLERAVKDLSGS